MYSRKIVYLNLTPYDDNNEIMRSFIMIFSVFALLLTVTVSTAHAHITPNTTDTNISQDHQHVPNSDSHIDCCGMTCNGCHHIAANTSSPSTKTISAEKLSISEDDFYLSDVVYGLKRPPKS